MPLIKTCETCRYETKGRHICALKYNGGVCENYSGWEARLKDKEEPETAGKI